MLDIALIRQNPEIVKKAADDKNMPVDVARLLALDAKLREGNKSADTLRSERNKLSKEIPKLKDDERNSAVAKVKELKESLAALESSLAEEKIEFDDLMLRVPSIPAPEVPLGKGEEDNVELRRVGEMRQFDFEPRDHIALCELHDLADTARGAKVSGSRFYFLKNEAVILELAICRFVMDTLRSKGYTPMVVPQLVRENAMRGTGYFPLGFDQAYKLPEDELFLVGTSEVSLVSYHQDEIIDNLIAHPIKYAGISTCFRREAGTYGKDTRGLYRVHQFQKVEQVVVCEADDKVAEALHYELLDNAETVMKALELPYRVCLACTGEIGIGQVRKHEIETWMPSRMAFSETHSCSTMGDFQARRSNIRYRTADGLKHAFTLNNTAIASPRVLIPLLETYQNADGSINIPKVLQPYTGFNKIG